MTIKFYSVFDSFSSFRSLICEYLYAFSIFVYCLFSRPTKPQSLLELLCRTAKQYSSKGLKIYDEGLTYRPINLTYSDLLQRSQSNGQQLLQQGIVQRGEVIMIYFEDHYHNVLWTWSVIAAGAVPAILSPLSYDSKASVGQMENLANTFDDPMVITTGELASKFQINPKITIHTVESMVFKEITSVPYGRNRQGPIDPDSLAVILFTSGSTGHSKAIEFTHRQLITSCIAKQQMHQISSQTIFMAWNSFDHSAHFCELHLNAMNAGANMVMLPAASLVQRPQDFFLVLSEQKIGYSFAANFFLSAAADALFEQKDEKYASLDLSAMRVLMVGGEANRTDVIAKADGIFRKFNAPSHVVKAAYGLSETCSACFYSLQSPTYDLQHGNVFASVGKHLPQGIELRIVDDSEEGRRMALGEAGRIQLRGEIVFRRYHNNREATASCMKSNGWFDTGDLGCQDTMGRLIITGRRKEILILNGNNYSSFEIEHTIQNADNSGISPSYVASFSSLEESSQSEGIVILFNPTDEIINNEAIVRQTIHSINKACISFCGSFPLAVIPLPKSEMPKSTIGKLSRQKLKTLYEIGAFDRYKISTSVACSDRPFETVRQHIIAEILAKQTSCSLSKLGPDTSIMRTGIDSLAYLRIKHELEQYLDPPIAIPLSLLLAANSIGDLDTEIDKLLSVRDELSNTYNPVVIFRKSGSKNPLWLMHPGGGEVLNWLNLVSRLPDRPVYAIRAKGLHPGETPIQNLPEMLDLYESAILRVQPQGPYAILGLCFGGMLAFELTKRLEAKGQTVLFCGGIDVPPQIQLLQPKKSFKHFLLQLLAFHGLFSLQEALRLEKEVYWDENDDPHEFTKTIMIKYSEKATKAGLDRAKINRWCEVLFSAIEIVLKYEPVGKIVSYDCFLAAEGHDSNTTFEQWKAMISRWSDFSDSTGFYQLTGNHFSALHMPNLDILQRELMKAFERRGL